MRIIVCKENARIRQIVFLFTFGTAKIFFCVWNTENKAASLKKTSKNRILAL